MKRLIVAAAAGMMLVLSGCGDDSGTVETVQGADGDNGSTASRSGASGSPSPDPDAAVSRPVDPLAPADPGEPEVVKPRAGMDNVRPVRWESAKVTGGMNSGETVRVQFYGGVEPCDVLDRVEVDHRAQEVAISLFSGSDPARPDAVCIEIAKLKTVDVELDENLDGREIVDGNAN